MENLYKERLEILLNKTLKEILLYSFFSFVLANFLELTMPAFDDKKDTPSLLLEIFVQLTITVCTFMFLEFNFPARYGLISFVIITLTSQITFISKINLLSSKLFKSKIIGTVNNNGYNSSKKHSNFDRSKKTITQSIENYETENRCTSLNNLPSF